ncbi:hypothetical protein [Fodinibius sp. SL11]|uniref:hypothetical protein n=1 Tax=Fodinibius sp. SL11 TaxID=3425690 RepID=UPI003F881CEE
MKKNKVDKIRLYSLLSVLTIIIGIALLVFMTIVESEPGAIPLLLIVTGAGWYFITRYRLGSKHT